MMMMMMMMTTTTTTMMMMMMMIIIIIRISRDFLSILLVLARIGASLKSVLVYHLHYEFHSGRERCYRMQATQHTVCLSFDAIATLYR